MWVWQRTAHHKTAIEGDRFFGLQRVSLFISV
jgi:hypothetical protein